MFEPARHGSVEGPPWDAGVARTAIGEIVEDTLARFDPDGFWPAHPLDDPAAEGERPPPVSTFLYHGATGAIWALEHLHRRGAAAAARDFAPALERLLATNRAEYAAGPYPDHGSLLMGDIGVLLLTLRLEPSPAVADALYRRCEGNLGLPVLELMWGLPGSMLAARFAAAMTGEARWRDLYRAQAARLLADLADSCFGPIWTQHLYGRTLRMLGAVHGFAGNMAPLLVGWDWLDEALRRRTAEAVEVTLAATAVEAPEGVNWHAEARRDVLPALVQHCHGAPGMVNVFADAPWESLALDRLLARAGELIWRAGPLAKGSNLCHGTAGNGDALLKLHRRLGGSEWLARARRFAMSAIAQCRTARRGYGRGRYSLWTGDLGLAVYLADCIDAVAHFPTVDEF
jgi:hypothetical protein